MREPRKRTEEQARADLALAWEVVVSAARAFVTNPGVETFTALQAAMEQRDKLAERAAEQMVEEDPG